MKTLRPTVDKINALENDMKALSDDALKAKTVEFKERIQKGATVDQILPEAFAVCRKASQSVLSILHYDVQLIGGMILNRGSIAEMITVECKTLGATLHAYINALTGKGVHMVSVKY